MLAMVSSWAGILAMLPLVVRAARTFRPPRLPWAAAPLAHLPVAMLFAVGQTAIMLAIRKVAGVGMLPPGALIAEVRRDVIVYALVLAIILLIRAMTTRIGKPHP